MVKKLLEPFIKKNCKKQVQNLEILQNRKNNKKKQSMICLVERLW